LHLVTALKSETALETLLNFVMIFTPEKRIMESIRDESGDVTFGHVAFRANYGRTPKPLAGELNHHQSLTSKPYSVTDSPSGNVRADYYCNLSGVSPVALAAKKVSRRSQCIRPACQLPYIAHRAALAMCHSERLWYRVCGQFLVALRHGD
jgi:hypothetical protein